MTRTETQPGSYLRQRAFGRDAVRTMNTRTLLAQLAINVEDPDAERIQREVIADLDRVNGPDSPNALVARANLAGLIQDLGRLREAETLFRAVATDHRRILGPAHPGTLITSANHAKLLLELGHREEALALFRALLAVADRVLGDHPVTRNARHFLEA